ncbi:MAG TPA: YqaE/Pmp3 family membrane protein [Cryomorphaceae bacterium]|nr:YqaE/Pmp3 family membrane protein [Cryomorphaceae bacterium]
MKKPVVTKNEEKHTVENVALAQAQVSAVDLQIENPTSELKSEKANKADLAAIELSESLMSDATNKSAENSEAVSATPTALNDAYPLTIGNKSRTNLNYSPAATMAASGEATLLVIILTILLPPLGVALVFGIGTEFWISLILTLLFYVPGLIYSLIVIL